MITATVLVLSLLMAGILWNARSGPAGTAAPAESSGLAGASAPSSPIQSSTFTVPPRGGDYEDLPDLCQIDVSALGDWVTENPEGKENPNSVDDSSCMFSEHSSGGFQYLTLSASVHEDFSDAGTAFRSDRSRYLNSTTDSVDGKYIELGDYSFAAYWTGSNSGSLHYFVYTWSGNLTITTAIDLRCPSGDSSCYDLSDVRNRGIALATSAFESIPPAS